MAGSARLTGVLGGDGNWRCALPKGRADRVLLAVGAVALLLIVPLLWIFLAYEGALAGTNLWAGGIVLCSLTAGIGAAMLRVLDGGR